MGPACALDQTEMETQFETGQSPDWGYDQNDENLCQMSQVGPGQKGNSLVGNAVELFSTEVSVLIDFPTEKFIVLEVLLVQCVKVETIFTIVDYGNRPVVV